MPCHTPPPTTPPLAVAPQQAAVLLGSKESSLEKDRANGHLGIPYVKAGKRIFYRLSDLEAWLTANRTTSTKRGACHE